MYIHIYIYIYTRAPRAAAEKRPGDHPAPTDQRPLRLRRGPSRQRASCSIASSHVLAYSGML